MENKIMNNVNRRVVLSAIACGAAMCAAPTVSNAEPASIPPRGSDRRVITPERVEWLRHHFDEYYSRGFIKKMNELETKLDSQWIELGAWPKAGATVLNVAHRTVTYGCQKDMWADDSMVPLYEDIFFEMGEGVAIDAAACDEDLQPSDVILSKYDCREPRAQRPLDADVTWAFAHLRRCGADKCQLSCGPKDATGARLYYAIGFRGGVGPVVRRVVTTKLGVMSEDDASFALGVRVRYVPTHFNPYMVWPI